MSGWGEDAGSRRVLEDLIDGRLDWERVKRMMSSPKEAGRFAAVVGVLQDRVPWRERILLPYSEHLFIVERDGERLVKCSCGHEFGDYRENWKLRALIRVRGTPEELDELYPGPRKPDARLCELREFYCPDCATQLEVEAVPPGYPILFDFLPDLDAFYRDWLGQPLATAQKCDDRTRAVTRRWREEGC